MRLIFFYRGVFSSACGSTTTTEDYAECLFSSNEAYLRETNSSGARRHRRIQASGEIRSNPSPRDAWRRRILQIRNAGPVWPDLQSDKRADEEKQPNGACPADRGH